MENGNTPMGMLEGRSWGLFLLAGSVLVFYGALTGVEAFTDMPVPANIFEAGYVLGFLGLLGLYPTLSEEQPLLARLGVVAAVVGLVGVVLVSLRSFGHLAGVLPEYPAGWSVIIPLVVVGFVVGFLSFGLAALRSDIYPRTVGLAVLAPGVIVVAMLLHMAVGWDRPASAFVISSGQAMAHLAIGATLRQQSRQPEGDDQPDNVAAQVATDD